ncbi:MAG: maleylpyruvate isomerase N-terminal domain-containing protein [Candidatus Dormibacteria bacterium]
MLPDVAKVSEARSTFLAAGDAAHAVLGLAEVVERWDEASALQLMSVGALAAHLVRAVTTVESYIDAAAPADERQPPLSGAGYFVEMLARAGDVNAPLHVGVRERGAEEARAGHAAVLEAFEATLERLRARLPVEPDDRRVEVRGKVVLPLDEYLLTRIVELTVHSDDLCVSVGLPTSALPGARLAVQVLLEVAALRHGELGVLRALARRERDVDGALRVL